LRSRLRGIVIDRGRWPVVPAVILVTTLFLLALSGLRAGVPATALSTSTPGIAVTQPSTVTITSGPLGLPADASPLSSAPPAGSGKPPASPRPRIPGPTTNPEATFRTYRVKSGDTLGAIASKFNTTVSVLVSLNQLADARRLSIGQILLIPS
jgi:LysM repeat protein